MALHDYLAGLRRELRAAEQLGKDTAAQIRAEIARVEGTLGAVPEIEGAVAEAPERAVAAAGRRRAGR